MFFNWPLVSLTLLSMVAVIYSIPTHEKRSSDVLYGHYAPGAHCEINGQLISHGEIFTDPSMSRCLQHQCFFGSSFIYSEGCEDSSGGCHEVGEAWEERCITFTCTKTTNGGYNYFQPIVKNARCRDMNGDCHEPGDLFSYRLHGRLHQNCRCNITDNRIFYRCY